MCLETSSVNYHSNLNSASVVIFYSLGMLTLLLIINDVAISPRNQKKNNNKLSKTAPETCTPREKFIGNDLFNHIL